MPCLKRDISKCPWRIIDGEIEYYAPNGKVFRREMILEIDIILNTLHPINYRDGTCGVIKRVTETELVSINRYIMSKDLAFTPIPQYSDRGGKDIIRWHGDVPRFDMRSGLPVANHTYFGKDYIAVVIDRATLRKRKSFVKSENEYTARIMEIYKGIPNRTKLSNPELVETIYNAQFTKHF